MFGFFLCVCGGFDQFIAAGLQLAFKNHFKFRIPHPTVPPQWTHHTV
jgi:hypothetical protein